MAFKPDFILPAEESPQALWFVFQKDRLLLKTNDNGCLIPCSRDLAEFNFSPIRKQYLGALDGRQCYAAELTDGIAPADGWTLQGLRETFDRLEEELIWIAGRVRAKFSNREILPEAEAISFAAGAGIKPKTARKNGPKSVPPAA